MATDFWSIATSGDHIRFDKKKFAAEVQYILLQFEKPKEWADLSNCLMRLYRTIHQSTIRHIPYKETICKRLAQCLNPQLPTGVHMRALEVYGAIFDKVGPEGLSEDLALFSSGLFPFFIYSSLSVRPLFLNLIDQYYIPLNKRLFPCLIGLLICILPGLDEEKSETYEAVFKILEKISNCVSEKSFMRALWVILLKASKIRLQTIGLIANKLAPGLPLLPKERVDVLVPHRHVLVIKSLKSTTEDDSLLVLRETITMLIKHFPLDSNILSSDDKTILCCQCLKLLSRRDWSLNRRLYQWIFNSTNDFDGNEESSMDLEYFTKYSKDSLITAIEQMLMAKVKTLDEALIPIKIIVTFITDTDLPGITDKLMPALCIPILKYICKEHEEDEWRHNIIQETRLIFNPSLTPTSIVFRSIIDEYNKTVLSQSSKSSSAWYELLELSNVYLDELSPLCSLDAALCGLFMLLNNALQHLHTLKMNTDAFVINHVIIYISAVFNRVERILNKQGDQSQFSENLSLIDDEERERQLVEFQIELNKNISHHLNYFYTDALTYLQNDIVDISNYELNALDMLNELAVRFVAIESILYVVPVTQALSSPHAIDNDSIDTSDEQMLNKRFNENLGKRQSPKTKTKDDYKYYKLETWIKSILKCTTAQNPQLFCRGIKTFIELLRQRNNEQLRGYIEHGTGGYMRNIILQLWNGLIDVYSANHSEFVMLLLQLNAVIPESRVDAEAVIVDDLTQSEASLKIAAILKFGILWRYAHFHAPTEEVFPEAIGCILDNIEETDPKLRYYSRSFLAESITMPSHLMDPILRYLLSYGNASADLYSLSIFDVLRKFRHLSSIMGREGQAVIEVMQRHQAPPDLLRLVQGEALFNQLSGSYRSISKNYGSGMYEDLTEASQNFESGDEENMHIVFPRLKDPLGISYGDECIYDYIDLLVVITLKFICLDVNMSELFNIKDERELVSYAEKYRKAASNKNTANEENTMLFRCTAIDFMKLFISSIQPASRAKEVACLISRPLLFVLYQLHMENDTIIQTQLLYLLKVVMDRCHLECKTLSKCTNNLIELAVKFSKRMNQIGRRISRVKSIETTSQFGRIAGAEFLNLEENDPLDKTHDDDMYTDLGVDDTFRDYPRSTSDVIDVKPSLHSEELAFQDLLFDTQHGSTNFRMHIERKTPTLPYMYILNVAAFKRGYSGKVKRLSDDDLFIRIIEMCGRSSARIDRTRLLQSYIDFIIYNLKYLKKSQSMAYASSFLVEFCTQLNVGKEIIGIAGLSLYLRGVYYMLLHLTSKSINLTHDINNPARFFAEQNAAEFELYALGDVPVVKKKQSSKTRSNLMYCSDEEMHIELSGVVTTCIQCLIWAKGVKGEAELTSRDRGSWANATSTPTGVAKAIESYNKSQSRTDFYNDDTTEAIRLDIKLSVGTMTREILRIFKLLYFKLPYYFCEGCLYLWDQAEAAQNGQEIKQEILKTLNTITCFSKNNMVSLILDMLEPFAKSSRYKDTRGFFLLNCRVGDNTAFEFIHFVISTHTLKGNNQVTYETLKRLMGFVLTYPRQPSVLLWVFHTICTHDRLYPSKDLQMLNKQCRKFLGDLMLRLLYLSVGLYTHKVCNWLPPKLYELGLPLPVHILMMNRNYHRHLDNMDALPAAALHTGQSFAVEHAESYAMDPLECVCKNALAQLIIFNYDVSQLNRRTAVINIFFQVLCSNMSGYILPMLQSKPESGLQTRYLIMLLLSNLPFRLYDGWPFSVRKGVVEQIHNPDFFKTDRRSLRCFMNIFRPIVEEECSSVADRLIKLDFYTLPPHNSVFQSRAINIQSRIKYLKRLAFVLYACAKNTFAAHITTIMERLTNSYRTYDDWELKAHTLLVMRVLLVRMSQEHLTALWPVLLSELIKIFDSERRDFHMDTNVENALESRSVSDPDMFENANECNTEKLALVAGAVKIIDVACALRLNDFLIYQWMFVGDVDQGGNLGNFQSVDFKPFLTDIEALYPSLSCRRLLLENDETTDVKHQDTDGSFAKREVMADIDAFKKTSDVIDECIENELLELGLDEIDRDAEINIHPIYKVYRKAF
ncbi:bifunctional Protein dopey/Dopey [Babesia duncani]|uniref:Bifunctional Protein dopey/Dopey n=1 Tax=Babesia duncani TaxID=323732 RepID=A0AAD9PMS6_9APIC|nr:bifunctional Protein dopey/Dopey [Babesia duncani]